MKKLITILAITSLFSFQAFALTSEACNDPSSTCQAFQLGSEAQVLKDFSVYVMVAPSLGKVRRGEQINVVEGSTHRGKRTGMIQVTGEEEATLFTIECDPLSSDINYQGGVSSTLSACNLISWTTAAEGSSLSAEMMDLEWGFNYYFIEFQASVPAGAQDGDVTGSIHIEIAYE